MKQPERLARALTAWRHALGADRVRTDADTLARVRGRTFDRAFDIPAVVSPRTQAEVQATLRIAGETGQRVHVVSAGKNWGFGARQPARSPSVLIELSAMNRIVDFDPELGAITVQPGVTFAQVDAFLEDNGGAFFLAQSGGSPDGSLIANAIERGDGNGLYGDRANAVAGLEVVLPTGEVVRTGFRCFGDGRLARTRRAGVGPALDGLFFQSNLGVVTEATFWLQPRPAVFGMALWTIGDDAALPPFIDAARGLTQRGVLQVGGFSVWNRYKRLAAESGYPFDATGGKTPLRPESIAELPPWAATCSIHAESPAMAQAIRDLITERTGALVQSIDFFDAANPPAGQEGGFPEWRSTGENLRTTYWRKRAAPEGDFDPERDGCGVIWLCPAAPFSGDAVLEIFSLSERIGLDHGFEPHLGLNPISPQALNIFIALIFDLEVEGESERAMACHDELMAELMSLGHLPYRLGPHAFGTMPPAADDSAALIRALKARADPEGILDPGRYGIDVERGES